MIFYLLWRMPIVSFYANTYIAMLVLVVMFLLLLIKDKDFLVHTPMVLILAVFYLVLLVVENTLKGVAIFNNVYSVFLEALPIFLGYFIVRNKLTKLAKLVVFLTIATYAITAVTTYVGLLQFPNASRDMAVGDHSYLKYFPFNIGGFDFIYSLVLTHPLVVCVLRSTKKMLLAVGYSAICLLCVVESAYTTATLLLLASFFAYIFPIQKDGAKRKKKMVIIAIVFIVTVLLLPLLIRGIAGLAVLPDVVSDKMMDVANLLEGKSAVNEDAELRRHVYQMSWDTFTKNVMLGRFWSGNGTVGGHSLVLDVLAKWGLVGFSIYACFVWQIFRFNKSLTANRYTNYFLMLFLALVVLLLILNPHFWAFEQLFLAPVFFYYLSSCDECREELV